MGCFVLLWVHGPLSYSGSTVLLLRVHCPTTPGSLSYYRSTVLLRVHYPTPGPLSYSGLTVLLRVHCPTPDPLSYSGLTVLFRVHCPTPGPLSYSVVMVHYPTPGPMSTFLLLTLGVGQVSRYSPVQIRCPVDPFILWILYRSCIQ